MYQSFVFSLQFVGTFQFDCNRAAIMDILHKKSTCFHGVTLKCVYRTEKC